MSLVIALDTETTAPRPGQICQLAYIARDGGRVSARNYYFAVDEMTPRALSVHHLTAEALDGLSGGARFSDRAEEIYADLARADLLVAHSAKADMDFLRAEFSRVDLTFSPENVLCTRDLYVRTRRVKDGLRVPWPPLQTVLRYCGVEPDEVTREAERLFGQPCAPHDARWDAAAVMEIQTRMAGLES